MLPAVQVQELQAELRAALAEQEAAGKRAEEQVEEERARAARALRQRSEEADWRAAEREAEAGTALARAEKLRQAAADCEAAATRKVRGRHCGPRHGSLVRLQDRLLCCGMHWQRGQLCMGVEGRCPARWGCPDGGMSQPGIMIQVDRDNTGEAKFGNRILITRFGGTIET